MPTHTSNTLRSHTSNMNADSVKIRASLLVFITLARQQAAWVKDPFHIGLHPALSLIRATLAAITRTTPDLRGHRPRPTHSHADLLPRTITKLARLELPTLNHQTRAMWYIDSSTTATTDTHGSNELRINAGHVWALEHRVATGILAATDYTFTTPD